MRWPEFTELQHNSKRYERLKASGHFNSRQSKIKIIK